jgi:hypothetical protein
MHDSACVHTHTHTHIRRTHRPRNHTSVQLARQADVAAGKEARRNEAFADRKAAGRLGACAVLCCAVLCCAVLCCAVLCCAVLCCAVLCCAVLCCAVLCCARGACCLVLCGASVWARLRASACGGGSCCRTLPQPVVSHRPSRPACARRRARVCAGHGRRHCRFSTWPGHGSRAGFAQDVWLAGGWVRARLAGTLLLSPAPPRRLLQQHVGQ